jgi:hypothetical protein
MTLENLCKTHTVVVKAMTCSVDADMNPVYAIGPALRTLQCRLMPKEIKQNVEFDQRGFVEIYSAMFTDDPVLDIDSIVVWSGKVFRVLGVENASGMNWVWIVDLKHLPQMDEE